MKHTFIRNEQAETSGLAVILAAIGGIVLTVTTVIIWFSLMPYLGDTLDSTTAVPAGSSWNSLENPTLPTGSGLWNDVGGMIGIALVIAVVSLIIYILRSGF